jgi:hypothetical protein
MSCILLKTCYLENSGNIAGGQSGAGNMYSDPPIFQGQSTEQDS